MVMGDEAGLRQMLGNLVNNALVHTDPETRVSIRVEPAGDRVILSVTDDGPGMQPDEAVHAFDRFWRADEARQRSGTGLGLAIVQQLAEAHGGHATIDTAPGVGTTVRVVLSSPPSDVGSTRRDGGPTTRRPPPLPSAHRSTDGAFG